MKTIDVYKQYFEAQCNFSGVQRRGVSVMLTSESGEGNISYSISVNFFPHADEEDFSITYDAMKTQAVYEGKGRRSKKREGEIIESLREKADLLAQDLQGVIMWDKPLNEAVWG